MSLQRSKKPLGKIRLFLICASAWLVFISCLHLWLNFDHGNNKIVNMGYMPVITNLAAPLLDYVTHDDNDLHFHALKFNSFSDMAEALRNDKIQAAFIIAPLAIVLHQQNPDYKVVYIGNRHESTLVARKELQVKTLRDLKGKTIAVPMRYSGHNLCLRKIMEQEGLQDHINIVELNPPDMPSALATGALDAYFVGEPFAAQALKDGSASLVFRVEDVWKSFICNVLLVKQELIENDRDTVDKLVQGAARSGFWVEKHPEDAAAIVASYWNQPPDLVKYALTVPRDRVVYDQFLPKKKEMQEIADLMMRYNLQEDNDISGLVDDQFARTIRHDVVERIEDIMSGKPVPENQSQR